MSLPLLGADGLSKCFSPGGKEFAALYDAGFFIAVGDLALVDSSGMGKSTAARILLQCVEAGAGKVADGVLRPGAVFIPLPTVARLLDDPLRIHGVVDGANYQRRLQHC